MSTRAVPVEVMLGGRTYRFAAPDNQIERLQQLAARVDALFTEMRHTEPHADRDRQMVLCCLTLASDLADAGARLDDQASAVTQFHRQLTDKLANLLPVV
jgi:cell division protein ZapA (FtsZ GTPase activity inhibitor)